MERVRDDAEDERNGQEEMKRLGEVRKRTGGRAGCEESS